MFLIFQLQTCGKMGSDKIYTTQANIRVESNRKYLSRANQLFPYFTVISFATVIGSILTPRGLKISMSVEVAAGSCFSDPS